MIYRHTRGCPVCGSRFREQRTQEYSYERCTRCQGIWLSFPVLELMVANIGASANLVFDERGARERRRCPDCHEALAARMLFLIPVDVCLERSHGVWFDKDELSQVLERVSGATPIEPPPAPTSFSSLLAEFFSS